MKCSISKSKIFLVFLYFLIFFTSCNPDNNNNNSSKKVFKYNESSGILTLDPAFAKDQSHTWICNQLYNSLVQLDENLNVKPCISKKWEVFPDARTYVFHLRNDVFFHDNNIFKNGKGRHVVASDFEYSLKRLANPELASPGAWTMEHVARNNNELSIKAVDDTTLVIQLANPFPPFISVLAMQYCSVIPKEAVEYYGKNFRKNPVGTGPFQLKLWKEGVKLVLVKNENYFEYEGDNKLPYLDAIAVSFIVDKQTAFLEFIKGNIDIISGIDASYKDEILTRNGKLNPKYQQSITIISQPYLNTEYLGFLIDNNNKNNVKKNPLLDKRVRQAINYGFDRAKMIRYLRNNTGKPGINGFIPQGLPGYDSTLQGYSYNPDKARNLLSEAGYPNGIGLPDITLYTTSSYLDICEFIQHQLANIGINLKIEINQAATLRSMIAKTEIPFFRGSWIADYPDAENYLMLFYSKNFCPQGSNYTHFSNKKFDELFEKARFEVNDSIRFELYKQMDKIIVEESPVVVLYYDQVLRFVKKNIINLGGNPLNLLDLKRVKKV